MSRMIILLVILALSLSACDYFGQTGDGTDDANTEYFHGSEGVRMQFVPGSPPSRMFYYLGSSDDENSFEVSVELKNVGSSDAVGATYISGYSPDIIKIRGVDIEPQSWTECIFDYGSSSNSGPIGGQLIFDCPGIDGDFTDWENWDLHIDEIGEVLGIDLNGVTINNDDGYWSFNVGIGSFGSVDVLNHGRALAIILSSLDLRAFNGFPFNGGQEKEGPGILRGDNHYYPGGDLGFQNFEGIVGQNWPPGLDETDVTFLVTSCYGYSTYAAPTICVDPAPYDLSEKVCTPQKITWSGGQGAPVAITELRQESTPRKVYLTFTIRNVGSGQVFNMGYLERCSPYYPGRLDSRHTNVVHIGDVRIGMQPLNCNPDGEIRLNNGIGTFTCEYDIQYATAKSAYETPVVIELWYGYQQTMRTSMNIKRAA